MIYTSRYDSPLGELLLAESGESLIGRWVDGQKYYGDSLKGTLTERETPVLTACKLWLDEYFSGKMPDIGRLSLAPSGGEFRQSVWKALCEIPYGQTVTYGQIAKRLAKMRGMVSMSAQAVGGAVGHNRISIIIPCHRVVGSDGSLTGYAAGISAKLWLLSHEGVDMDRFYVPLNKT